MATTLTILTSASEFVFVDKKILEDAKDVVASRMKDSCILEDQESDMVRHKICCYRYVKLSIHCL